MENRIELIKGNAGKITGVKARCNGEYALPSDKLNLPTEDFKISSNDVGILLSQYNPDDMFYIRDGYYGTYYMSKDGEYNSKLEEVVEKLKEREDDLREQYKISDSRADRLVVYSNRLKSYSSMYQKIPKWLRRILFDKDGIRRLDGYEEDGNRI